MNFSNTLIDGVKKTKGIGTDSEVAELLPNMNKGNLSKIRKGERHLTEEQALWIANQCKLDTALVLVELAAECAKTTTAQTVWHNLAKKLKAATSAIVLTSLLLFSHVSGHFPHQRRYIP